MKKLFLMANMLLATATAFAERPDSIIVNIGNRKKVVLIGQTKQDLRDLEKYDLNKVAKQMNQEIGEMPSKSKKMVIRDYTGQTYTKDSSLASLTKWQRIVKNTKMNMWYGVHPTILTGTNAGGTFETNQTEATTVWYRDAGNIGISFLHQSSPKKNGRTTSYLKKGIILEKYKFLQDRTIMTSDESRQTYWASENTNLYQLKIQFLPTLGISNKQGKNVFNVSLGGHVGLASFRKTKGRYFSNDNTGLLIYTGPQGNPAYTNQTKNKLFFPPNAGLMFVIGYKWIQAFYKSDWGLERGSSSNIPLYSPIHGLGKQKAIYTTMGIRIGS